MQNKIVNMTRATLALMVMMWLGTLPALGQDCKGWIDEDRVEKYWQEITFEQMQNCLKDGADVHARDKRGRSPLHWVASGNKNPEVIMALLDAGVNVDEKDQLGNTPLHWAASENENPEVIKVFLDAGVDANIRGLHGKTPLHNVALRLRSHNSELVKVLLDAGADVNLEDKDGWTPLHNAALGNITPQIIIALLKAGADAKAKNSDGKTPFYYASANEHLRDTEAYWALHDAQYKKGTPQ